MCSIHHVVDRWNQYSILANFVEDRMLPFWVVTSCEESYGYWLDWCPCDHDPFYPEEWTGHYYGVLVCSQWSASQGIWATGQSSWCRPGSYSDYSFDSFAFVAHYHYFGPLVFSSLYFSRCSPASKHSNSQHWDHWSHAIWIDAVLIARNLRLSRTVWRIQVVFPYRGRSRWNVSWSRFCLRSLGFSGLQSGLGRIPSWIRDQVTVQQ